MITSAYSDNCYEFRGLSTDTKPVDEKVSNGSVFFEMDTGKVFMFDKTVTTWVELDSTGGGSGGGGEKLPENVTLFERERGVSGYKGTPLPVGEVKISSLYVNKNLTFEEIDKIINDYCDKHGHSNQDWIIFPSKDPNEGSFSFNKLNTAHMGIGVNVVYVINQDHSVDNKIHYIHPLPEELKNIFEMQGLKGLKEGWNVDSDTISFVDSYASLTESDSKELAPIFSTTPFEEIPGEELELSTLKDVNNKVIYPKTTINSLLNEDGSAFIFPENIKVPIIPLIDTYTEGQPQYQTISREHYNLINTNKVPFVIFRVAPDSSIMRPESYIPCTKSVSSTKHLCFSSTTSLITTVEDIVPQFASFEDEVTVQVYKIDSETLKFEQLTLTAIPTNLKGENNQITLERKNIDPSDAPIVLGDSIKIKTINNTSLLEAGNIDTTILTSPNGSKYRIKVDDTGALTTEKIIN